MPNYKPTLPPVPASARKHADYPAYLGYRTACQDLRVDCSHWKDWLALRELQQSISGWDAHPRYQDFSSWSRDNPGAIERCPHDWPDSFRAWLRGERW